MRHLKKFRKFGRPADYRKAFLWNLVGNLILHEKIKTTSSRAKEIRFLAERAITKAKNNTLANRRLLLTKLEPKAVNKLFKETALVYKNRPGGYTRIMKWGARKNDAAPVSIIELVK